MFAVALVHPFTTIAAVVSTFGIVKVNVFAPETNACEPVAGVPLPNPDASTAESNDEYVAVAAVAPDESVAVKVRYAV